MHKKTISIIVIFFLTLASGCSTTPNPNSQIALTVLAAASLSEPFQEIASQFESDHPTIVISFNFAGSQQLARQLAEGAQADVFASASQKYMTEAIDSGRVAKDTSQIFTRNRLVVITPSENPGAILSLSDLNRPGIKLILAAEEVPVGKYSLQFLDKASLSSRFPSNFKNEVLANVVSYEDNVKSVLTKVLLGEADAGIVYTSDLGGQASGKVTQLQIPDELNILAEYPIAVIQDSSNTAVAQSFVDFILSPTGQAKLEQYGFLPASR